MLMPAHMHAHIVHPQGAHVVISLHHLITRPHYHVTRNIGAATCLFISSSSFFLIFIFITIIILLLSPENAPFQSRDCPGR